MPWRAGLAGGDAVAIIAPRICESVRVASGRLCQVGRTARDDASPTKAAERGPEQPIEGRQNRSPAFSLESRELQPQGSILQRDGLMAAQEQSKESNERQDQGWHICMLLQISVLGSDEIMASHRPTTGIVDAFHQRSGGIR